MFLSPQILDMVQAAPVFMKDPKIDESIHPKYFTEYYERDNGTEYQVSQQIANDGSIYAITVLVHPPRSKKGFTLTEPEYLDEEIQEAVTQRFPELHFCAPHHGTNRAVGYDRATFAYFFAPERDKSNH